MPKRRVLAVDPATMKALGKAPPSFDRAELLAGIITGWGGVAALARDIVADYQAAPRGSMARQRVAQLICQLISAETAANEQRSTPVDQMDEDEICAILTGMLPSLRIGVQTEDADA